MVVAPTAVRAVRTALGSVLALLLLAACAGGAGSSPGAVVSEPPAAAPVTARTPSGTPTAQTSPPPVEDLIGTVDDDDVTVVVGRDAAPGTYRTVDEQTPDGMNGGLLFDRSCAFGQYDDPAGGLESIIAGGTADGGRPTVTLSEGHLFRTKRCGVWQRVDPADLFTAPDQAPTTVTDGMWLVGEDLRPGTYRTEKEFTGEYVEGEFCGWEVDSTWTDWDAEILAFGFAGPGPGEVTVETGQQLVTSECGAWHLVVTD